MKDNFSKKAACRTPRLPELPLGGITPFTTIDFPGRLAAVLFTQGCAWRCPYCFNRELQPFAESGHRIKTSYVLDFIKQRRGFLDGIVFSGGEATAHLSLGDWMYYIKSLGYEVGLHTTGMFPERLKNVLPFCDWVGMDIKAPFEKYARVTGVSASGENARQSVRMILESHVEYEFRTTIPPEILSEEDVLEIGRELHALGAEKYVLQKIKNNPKTSPGTHSDTAESREISADLKQQMNELFSNLQVRV